MPGLCALPSFPDFMWIHTALLEKLADKDCGRQFRRLHELMRELYAREYDKESYIHADCLENVDEIKKITNVIYNQITQQYTTEDEADQTRNGEFQQGLHTIFDYTVAAFVEWDEDFVNALSKSDGMSDGEMTWVTDVFNKKAIRPQSIATAVLPELRTVMKPARWVSDLTTMTVSV